MSLSRVTHEQMLAAIERCKVACEANRQAAIERGEDPDETPDEADRLTRLDRSGSLLSLADKRTLAANKQHQTQAVRAVEAWQAKRDRPAWLVLSGSPGCGKTFGAGLAIAAIGGRSARAKELLRLYDSRDYRDQQRFEMLTMAHLLVLDEVGVEAEAEAMTRLLGEIFDMRQAPKLTIITTNLPGIAFMQRYADIRIHDRAKGVQWVATTNGSLRKTPGDQ